MRSPSGLDHTFIIGPIAPETLVIDVALAGKPIPKGRVKTGDNGNHYPPARTVAAEQTWATAMVIHRQYAGPVPWHCGAVVVFSFTGAQVGDTDNLVKLVLDAGNKILYDDDRQITQHAVWVLTGQAAEQTRLLVWHLD